MAEADDDPGVGEPRDQLQRDGGGSEGDNHGAGAHGDQRVGVVLSHRADELGRVHALAAQIDEWPLDMHAERAGHAHMRLAGCRQRGCQHVRRVGDDGRQKAGHSLAPVRMGDPGDRVDRRLGVEQHAATAVNLPVDETGGEDAAAEIDLFAAVRTVREVNESADRAAVDDERVIVEKPLAVEQARAIEHFHRAASLPVATAPPTIRIAPSVASYSARFKS